ncbi:MAG: ribonuclease D [Solirubrobacteraceae bacterium]
MTLTNSAGVEYCARLAREHGRLCIDTEFISEGHYRAMLCLTQVAVEDPAQPGGQATILIDGLDRTVEVTPLAKLLADPEIAIIMHAGRQDVAILKRAWATELVNIFDTQIAAGFVGESAQAGYANLLGSVLGSRVGKTASYTRWDARPLTGEQLSYAAEDVEHLFQLADELTRRLRAADREQWALEEFRRLETATDERDPDTVWERLPRVGQLDPQSRAVARRIAAWRERTAAAEDRPVGHVLQDQPLLELAKRAPRDLDALRQIRGVHLPFIKRHGRELIEAINSGVGDPPIPRERRRSHSDPADAPLIALAEALLRARAIETGLAYELLASRGELEQIIAASRQSAPEPDVRTLTGWRRDLIGADLEALLAGRTMVAVGPGRRLALHSHQ